MFLSYKLKGKTFENWIFLTLGQVWRNNPSILLTLEMKRNEWFVQFLIQKKPTLKQYFIRTISFVWEIWKPGVYFPLVLLQSINKNWDFFFLVFVPTY